MTVGYAGLRLDPVLADGVGAPYGPVMDAKSIQIECQLNVPASVTIEFNMDNDLYAKCLPNLVPRLKIYRPPTIAELAINSALTRELVFYGDMLETSVREDAKTGYATLNFQDPRWHWNDMQTWLPTYQSYIDYNAMLYDVIGQSISPASATPFGSRTGGRTDIEQRFRADLPAYGASALQLIPIGTSIAAAVEQITRADNGPDCNLLPWDGYDQYVSLRGSGTDFKAKVMGRVQGGTPTLGTTRLDANFVYSEGVDFAQAGLTSNCETMRRSYTKVLNQSTIRGTENDSGVANTYVNTNNTSVGIYGIREETLNGGDATTGDQMIATIAGHVTAGAVALGVVEVVNPYVNAPQPFIDFDLGDIVFVSCRRKNMEFYDSAMRVQGFTVKQDNTGKLSQTLVLV